MRAGWSGRSERHRRTFFLSLSFFPFPSKESPGPRGGPSAKSGEDRSVRSFPFSFFLPLLFSRRPHRWDSRAQPEGLPGTDRGASQRATRSPFFSLFSPPPAQSLYYRAPRSGTGRRRRERVKTIGRTGLGRPMAWVLSSSSLPFFFPSALGLSLPFFFFAPRGFD